MHLATIYLVWAGTWLSAYFILAANSWMQHPVGYEINSQTGRAEATDIFKILFQGFVLFAWGHAIFAGLMTGGFLVLGVVRWAPSARSKRRDVPQRGEARDHRRPARFPGCAAVVRQPLRHLRHRRPADEDRRYRGAVGYGAAGRVLAFQIGGFTKSDQTPSFDIEIPRLLSFLATGSFSGKVDGINPLQSQAEQQYGRGNYIPDIRLVYWSMRVMAYLGTLSVLLALWGGWLLWRKKLEGAKWFQRVALADRVPVPLQLRRLILTEAGRQPWVAYGLLKTEDAVSGSVSAWTVGLSLGLFASLYTVLGLVDLYLMRAATLGSILPRSAARARRGAATGAGLLR